MFDDFASEILRTEVAKKHPKSGYLKKCGGLALITKIGELGADSKMGRAAIFDMMILTVKPNGQQGPEDLNVPGEAVSKWFKFEDGDARKRSVIKADFKRQLCAIFDVDPATMTAEQYKTMGQAAAQGKCEGLLIRYEPRVSDKGQTFHDFYNVVGKNTPAEVKARAEKLAKGAGPEAFL